ncbi:hypothetical protein [Limnospira platensis]|uniref:hypothetical protein n=1 Tax=Limnospira platensis TaxID=118562 RepID=UPI0021AA0513|nr:hypothetical protein APLC1_1062 [Arthrospira platensis C1]
MTIDEQKLARVEQLRIPLDDPTAPLDWKDWYHYVLLDPDTQIRVLVNLTAIARPGTGEIQTSLMVTVPTDFLDSDCRPAAPFASFGTTFSQEWNPSQISPEPVHWQGQGMELQVNGTQTRLEVQDQRSQLFIELAATATATPLLVTENSPFGSGFIGWGLVPGLTGERKLIRWWAIVSHSPKLVLLPRSQFWSLPLGGRYRLGVVRRFWHLH